jgi:hypothetical protein
MAIYCASLFFIFILTLHNTIAGPQSFEEILTIAKLKKLYERREWYVLLHYKPHGNGVESLIDDPEFFLSPEGKKNPEAELDATIRALFESELKDDNHPKCRFIARYEWLKEEIGFDDKFFSDILCTDFNDKYNRVQPYKAVLVFPAAYMNNPSSMFGHTLLRIDSTSNSKLIAHAVNYAANVENAGILYPVKGIFGFYKGYFKVFPYYDMIRDYNDTEQRDMWEYSLNLSPEEVRRMFLHLWELKDRYSYYYFFDENCSYNLLFLLESARPSLNLTDKIGYWTIPIDTIRVVKESGLVEKITYRPSMATRIKYFASKLNSKEKEIISRIVNGDSTPDEITESSGLNRINLLDTAIEVIQYRYNKGLIDRDKYLKVFLSTLRTRSELGKITDETINMPVPERPEDSHFSNRISIGIVDERSRGFAEFSYRPAYHSLIDPDTGIIEGSQIIFLETIFRGYSDGRVVLDALDVIDIMSLSPRDIFFNPLSWKIKTGLFRKDYYDSEHLVYSLNPGFGVSYKNKITGIFYLLGEMDLALMGKYRDNYAIGAGVQIGLIKNITDFWKINFSAHALYYGFRDRFNDYLGSAVQTFRLTQENSLNVYVEMQQDFGNEKKRFGVNWNYYF